MAGIYFYNYYCHCGSFLFKNCDIADSVHFLKRNYIFVGHEDVKKKIYISGSCIVKCETCNSSLGGMVFRSYLKLPDLVRFCGHRILREKVYLDIYQCMDGNVPVKREFEVRMMCQTKKSRKTSDH